jgi:hypothetical protein
MSNMCRHVPSTHTGFFLQAEMAAFVIQKEWPERLISGHHESCFYFFGGLTFTGRLKAPNEAVQ